MREFTPRKQKAYDEIARAIEDAPLEILQEVFMKVNDKVLALQVGSLSVLAR